MKSFTKLLQSKDQVFEGWDPSELFDPTVSGEDFDLEEEKIRLVELFSQTDEMQLNVKKTRLLSDIDVKPWRPNTLEDVLAAEADVDQEGEFSSLKSTTITEWQPSEFLEIQADEDEIEYQEEMYELPSMAKIPENDDDLEFRYQFIETEYDESVEEPDEIDELKIQTLEQAQQEAHDLVEQMMMDAQKRTDDLMQLTYAETEAARIQMDWESQRLWMQANAELEAIKEQAYQEGFSNGHQTGFSEIESTIHASQEILEQFSTWRASMLEKSEGAVIEMVKDIAEIIFSEGVELNQDTLHQNFTRVLAEARALGDLRVYVNPEDVKIIDPAWKDYQVQVSGQNIKIYPTEAIRRGGCYVEGQQGSIDARVENQLTAILDSLAVADEAEPVDQEAVEEAANSQFTWL